MLRPGHGTGWCGDEFRTGQLHHPGVDCADRGDCAVGDTMNDAQINDLAHDVNRIATALERILRVLRES